jgi:SAM-dependent methyltransferase
MLDQMSGTSGISTKPHVSSLVSLLGITMFLSAFLLFWCEPMVGKMMLPYVGGTAAVWTTCVLFFQILLLAGYLYAHLLGGLKSLRLQLVLHAFALLAPLAFLPIRFGSLSLSGTIANHPVTLLLGRLFAGAGIPFFVIATTAPLLQTWLSKTKEYSGRDPYFLYAASNAGSLLALTVHPFLLEPWLGITLQSRFWFGGYVALLVMMLVATYTIWRKAARFDRNELLKSAEQSAAAPRLLTQVYWVGAAFLPSALMLAVTNHISTNLTSAPFVWVVPLGVYLLTFILAFARRSCISWAQLSRALPAVFVLAVVTYFTVSTSGIVSPRILNWVSIAGHVGLLFGAALLCHLALAAMRPAPAYLTRFYFALALGGVMGGVFAAIFAPALFSTVVEYPLLVGLIPLFRSNMQRPDSDSYLWIVPAVLGLISTIAFLAFRQAGLPIQTNAALLAELMFLIAIFQLRNRRQFVWAFAMFVIGNSVVVPKYFDQGQRLYAGRNFFGVKTVVEDPVRRLRTLMHGDTVHGIESTDPALSGRPLSYYHRSGPAGDVMSGIPRRGLQRLGIVGLGAGSMAAYAGTERRMTFFDIDPQVESIARQFFTYLDTCGTNCDVVIGDGRLELRRTPDRYFNLLMLDAFSSDAIPAHLVSREALQLYLSKITPDGVLVFHVTNRYLDVVRLVSAALSDAHLVSFLRRDVGSNLTEGRAHADYIVAARRLEDLGSIPQMSGWAQVKESAFFQVWTDDYSNLLTIASFR